MTDFVPSTERLFRIIKSSVGRLNSFTATSILSIALRKNFVCEFIGTKIDSNYLPILGFMPVRKREATQKVSREPAAQYCIFLPRVAKKALRFKVS